MIDLSFLTEEEQEAIMKVLQRDAVLKRKEEERVRHLPEKIKDDQQLKNMSGQWFYEAKAQRHRDRIHGTDIIRASMRRKKLHVAAEQTKDTAHGVNNVSRDAFIPSDLAGLAEEPEEPAPASLSKTHPAPTVTDIPGENSTKSSASPPKQRKNPFNSSQLPEDHLSQQTRSERSTSGRAGFFQTSKEGELSKSAEKSCVLGISGEKPEKPKRTFPCPENGAQVKAPVPRARKVINKSNDLKRDDDQPCPRPRADFLSAKSAPRSILKRNSSSSSTDSDVMRPPPHLARKGKTLPPSLARHERVSEKGPSLEDDSASNTPESFKHVRFVSTKEDLPQSPGVSHGQKAEDVRVFQSDGLKNGSEVEAVKRALWKEPAPSPDSKPSRVHQQDTRPRASQNEACELLGSGHRSPSDVLTARSRSVESLSTVTEDRAKSPELLRLGSEFAKSPADKLSCAEPESSRVPDHSCKEHQQGKRLPLKGPRAKMSSHSAPHGPEVRKTVDESVSKVLDWFNRSTYSDDRNSSIQLFPGTEPREKDSESQPALWTHDASLKDSDSEPPPSTEAKLTSVGPASTLQAEGNIPPPSRNFQDDNVNNNPSSSKYLGQQGKERSGILQPAESYSSNNRSENVDSSHVSKSIEESRVLHPSSNKDYYIGFKGSNAEDPYPCDIMDSGSLEEEAPELHTHGENRLNLDATFDSPTIAREPTLTDTRKARRDISAMPGSIDSPPETASSPFPGVKPEVPLPQEMEAPESQAQREKYKRVSDRISFWESETASSKLCRKEPTPPHRQGHTSRASLAVRSHSVSVDSLPAGDGDYHQVTAKWVFLEEDDEETQPSQRSPPGSTSETRLQMSDSSEHFPSADLSDKAVLQNKISEPVKRSLGSLDSGRDIISPSSRHPPNISREIHAPSPEDRHLTGDLNHNFKVLSLRERMEEPNTEQTYNYAQFENLRKFWNLGANPNHSRNVEKNHIATGTREPETFSTQIHKGVSDSGWSGKNTHEVETRLHQRNVPAEGGVGKFNSEHTLQVLPDETSCPSTPSTKSACHLLGSESSEETVDGTGEGPGKPECRAEKDDAAQEIQEFITKTRVLSKDYKDTLRASLQKLLSEAPSSAAGPSGPGKQGLSPGGSDHEALPGRTHLPDSEEESIGPRDVAHEHVDNAAAPPRVTPNTRVASLDQVLKGATGRSPLSETDFTSVTAEVNSEPEESQAFEEAHNIPACERKVLTAAFPEGNAAAPQKSGSGECQPGLENLLRMASRASRPPAPPSHPHHSGSLVNAASSQVMPSLQDAPHEVPPSPQREISEVIEKVTLPPKPALNDFNTALKRLLREAWFSSPTMAAGAPEDVKPQFPDRGQALWAPKEVTVPDKKDFYSWNVDPNKSCNAEPPFPARLLPSEQILNSSDSAVALCDQQSPQEVAEIVTETMIQPQSGLLEFRAGIERLLKETAETPSTHASGSGAPSPSEVSEVTEQTASPLHPEEIKETIEKSEAPPVTESAFDVGLEKLLKEMYEASQQPQASVKEETSVKRPSQSEQAKFLGPLPRFCQTPSQCKSNDFRSHVNPCDSAVRADKGVAGFSEGFSGSESRLLIPDTPPSCMDLQRGNPEATNSSEHGQEPGFKATTKALSESRAPQPLVINGENPRKASKVELTLASPYKKPETEEEKETSDSDFSDENIGSNAESWGTTSSSEEEPSPVLKALERNTPRIMPSKSLEDVSSDPPNQAKIDNLPEELIRSAEDVFTVPPQPGNQYSPPDTLERMSKSVPEFLQDESDDRETDTASESSYRLSRSQKSRGSLTNLSSCSGMTSLSSVSGSVMSVYSGDFGNLDVKGNIQFAVDYVDSLQELHVFVAQCRDLAAADLKKQRSDPYVKAYLLSEKGKMGKKKTLVMKKTLNPVFNEILRYKIEKQILQTQKLHLSVWHRDTFKRNSFLGEVELDLENWDWNNRENKQLKWYPLKRKTAPVALEAEHRGEMKLALQYVPEPVLDKKVSPTGEVHIWVKECIDLPQLRGSHLNAFVKCTILPDTSRKSRQKTRAVGKTTNPIFNHTMVYDGFRPEDLTEACVELTVWDHYKLTNQFLGGLRIGFGTGESYGTEVDWMDSTSEEVALWEKMVNSPNTWIEATLPLRMLLIARVSK